MTKKIAIVIISVFMAVIIFAGGFLLGFNFTHTEKFFSGLISRSYASSENILTGQESANLQDSRNADISSIEETIDNVYANALNKKTMQELISAAIEGVLSSLDDKYSDYFSSDEYSRIIDSFSGTMSGIGAKVSVNESGQVIIVNVIEDTPASRISLKEKDVITAVNGTSIEGMALDQVVAMIKGEEGTEVVLKIFRPSENKSMDYKIKRQWFYVPNFYTEILEDNILYIQYSDFQEDGAAKLEEKLKDIITEDTESIILDLRNNLGGTLNDAVELCDIFIDSGTIVTVKGRSDNKDSYQEFKAKKGIYASIPMIVLINGYSASAAELTAGALRDLKRATLIGGKSYGKGTVQIFNDLHDGSGIKYTTAKYYLPSGETIDGIGIEPDIELILTPEDAEDTQLNKAIEELTK